MVRDATGKVDLTVVLAEKVNLEEIVHRVMVLRANARHVMVKVVHRAKASSVRLEKVKVARLETEKLVVLVMAKADHRENAASVVVSRDEAKVRRGRDVRWDLRILSDSSKMRCDLMRTPMESSAKKSC